MRRLHREQVRECLAGELFLEIRWLQLPYFIPRQAIVKPAETDKLGYNLEVIVLEQTVLENEPLWKTGLTITQGASIQIAIEVVSTNWQNDYGHKFIDYGAL